MRELARRAEISNAYLSQVERGIHAPSVRVLRALAEALDVPVEFLVTGSASRFTDQAASVEIAIRSDTLLAPAQKAALISVYRSFRDAATAFR